MPTRNLIPIDSVDFSGPGVTSGAEALHQVLSQSADRGVTVAISRTNEPTADLLAQYHLLGLIGENRPYPTNRHGIAAYRQERGRPGA